MIKLLRDPGQVMSKTTTKQFLTKKELAEYLGVSIYTIDSWVSQRREIPFVKMSKKVMFDLEDVNKWIEESKVYPLEIGK